MSDDRMTGARNVIDYAHHEVHSGSHFNLSYSVASIGGLITPNDTMTLSFKTPNTEKLLHLIFSAISSSGARFRFIEGKGTGGATPTGIISAYNNNRKKATASTILDIAGANAGSVSYDATLFTGTGSTVLVDEYIGADGRGNSFAAGSLRAEQEWVLAPNTDYQLSIFETDAVPGTIQMAWYEHTSIRPS